MLEVKQGAEKSWDCWSQILSCFFYKMTEVRRLREDELALIASKLGVTPGKTYGVDFLKNVQNVVYVFFIQVPYTTLELASNCQ